MTHQEILATIETLPKDVQFALVNSVLDRLSKEGPLPVSEALKAKFMQREEAFLANSTEGESWEQVRAELFEQ